MIFFWIVYDFFQPSNVWMLKRGKNLEFFLDTITDFFLLQYHLIHLFQSVLYIIPGILAQIHGGKRTFTEFLFNHVRIDHAFIAKVF